MDPQEIEAPSPEDIRRTRDKLVRAVELGHGVTLENPEVERLVFILAAMTAEFQEMRTQRHQLDEIVSAVLGYLHEQGEFEDGEPLVFPSDILDNEVVGFTMQWDPESEELRIVVEFDRDMVEGEVVE